MIRVILLGALLVLAAPARADLLSFQAIQDNTLIESADGSVSGGASERIFAGRSNQASNSIRRSVVAFDVASSIPVGAVIHSVALELTLISSNTASDLGLHRMLTDWGEGDSFSMGGSGGPSDTGDATWQHTFFSDFFWTTPGGDFVAARSAGARVDANVSSKPIWSSAGMIADVQGWLDDPGTQFGWILIGDESTSQTTQSFGSRERMAMDERPVLHVRFSPAQGPQIQEVALDATADATLIESTLQLPLANGAASLFSGTTPQDPGTRIRRSVIRFDVASTLPSDAMVLSATLELVPDETLLPHVISAHRLEGDWGEGDELGAAVGSPADSGSATWHHRFLGGDLWTTPGGDFAVAFSAQAFVDRGDADSGSWSTDATAGDVQAWVADPATDFGWLLIGNEAPALSTTARFPSRESGAVELRPRLVVQYIPEPGAMLQALAAIAPLLALRFRARSRRKRT